jgi:Ca-activated chloride channel family protein
MVINTSLIRTSVSFLLVLAVLTACTAVLQAQSRPRRVGQNPQSQTRIGQDPQSQTNEPTSPSRPPVLGGATRTGGTKPTAEPVNDGPEEVDAGDVIKVNTTLVTLPVSVMDRDGRYIPNLRKEDFRLWEEGVEQDVAFFSSVDKPFSLVLMIDTSGSTRFRLEDIQDAAITFVNQLRADDQVMVVSFDDDVRVLSEFTNDRNRLRDAIRHTRTGNGTRLYDAVDMVMNQKLSHVSGRKAVVLFTDGVDTTSRHGSYDSNIRDAEELDALVYPLQYDTFMDVGGGGGIGNWPGSRGQSPIDILGQILGGGMGRGGGRGGGGRGGRGPGGRGGGTGTSRQDYEIANQYLQELSERTGARSYQADSIQNIGSAFAKIAEELRRQYSLGYYPKNPAQAGERRQVRVKVNQPNLAVRTRDSYVFNPSATTTDTASQTTAPVLRRKLTE